MLSSMLWAIHIEPTMGKLGAKVQIKNKTAKRFRDFISYHPNVLI